MENYIWTMIMASWTPLIIHDSYELQTSMISDHSKWGFIRFTRSMITHDCYEHWLWAITVHRNSYEFGFWTINDQTHHTWWGGINAMKCWCSYMINTDSVSYYDPYNSWRTWLMAWRLHFMWIFLTLPLPDFPARRKSSQDGWVWFPFITFLLENFYSINMSKIQNSTLSPTSPFPAFPVAKIQY